ncbi:FtsK/SpoIIIE domain-containing protein [Microbacterium sp.]|uniref:FtsK/SpoIIIE domain-containing protein n=1 Tax=Microbacterium sp. TaxID=51671 RepID=UPI0039E6C22D
MNHLDAHDPDEQLALPPEPAPPARPSVPVLTALVPMAGALALWGITGSPHALWFAVLGPLLAGAGLADGWRTARRARRRAARERRAAVAQAQDELERRHERERVRLRLRHPDVAAFAARPDEVWRPVPARGDELVAGSGTVRSTMRVTGEGDDARALRAAARLLPDAPVTVPLVGGIAVVGPAVLAAAVARGLLLQVCLALPPGRLHVVDGGEAWADALPHRDRAAALQVRVSDAVGASPALDPSGLRIVRVPGGAPPPPDCRAVLVVTGPDRARLDVDGETREVRVEAVGRAQAERLAEALRAWGGRGARAEDTATLAALLAAPPPTGVLAAPIGHSAGEPFVVDLAVDGPHAIVIGITGSGKSELLTTWVAALCAAYGPARVSLLLVDFKGGRTFDALAALPHVTGVLTDLDEAAALRAVESLRAELRHRESVLARCGARDVDEAGDVLGRLVVVVDEYAALVAVHPGLHDLFADLSARGRALGIHLVLASQRAAGVFRDAVLANCPLRISLRVADRADSRAVLGSDAAAALPGRLADRGLALVRRAADLEPSLVRVAVCTAPTIAAVARAHPGPPARRPWLPALPADVPLGSLRVAGAVVLGLADEPEHQRRRPVVLPDGAGLTVVGRAGSGKTVALHAVAAQSDRAIMVPADPEAAWDAVAGLDELPRGSAVLVDDVDALLSRFPPEYAVVVAERLERCAREARGRGIRLVVSARRLTGATGRLAELLPHRALLALSSPVEHVAAGGEARGFCIDAPPGRARLDRVLVQFASVPVPRPAASVDAVPWVPARATAFVVHPGAAARSALAVWAAAGRTIVRLDDAGSAAAGQDAVVWGAPEQWIGHWRALAAAREHADLVVDAACAAEYRAVTGARELPPYALPGRSRAWLCTPEAGAHRARRIVLPGGQVRLAS